MFLCLVALYLAVFFACAVTSSAREGYWSPVTVFGIMAFYYYLSVPLELYLRGQEIFTTSPAVFGILPETRIAIGWCALLALLGFVAGHRFAGLGRLLAHSDAQPALKLPRSLRYVAIGGFFLLLLLYRTTLFERLSYIDANERRYNDPIFGYLTRLCLLSSCLIAGMLIQRRGFARAPALAIAILAMAWGFYTSDKNPILKAILGLSAFWLGKRSRTVKHLYFYCGGAVVAIAALPLFSAFRANETVKLRSAVAEFSVQNTDAKGPMISLVTVFDEDTQHLFGRSYLYSFVAWIPRFVWADRPYDLAQEFAFQQIPNWQPGMGLGFSLLAEGYLNFGYAGAFVQYFGIAFCLGRIWVALYHFLAPRGAATYWRAMVAVTYFEILVLMHRVPTSAILQSCIQELLIPVGAFCWIESRRKKVQRSPGGIVSGSYSMAVQQNAQRPGLP